MSGYAPFLPLGTLQHTTAIIGRADLVLTSCIGASLPFCSRSAKGVASPRNQISLIIQGSNEIPDSNPGLFTCEHRRGRTVAKESVAAGLWIGFHPPRIEVSINGCAELVNSERDKSCCGCGQNDGATFPLRDGAKSSRQPFGFA
jgi:hypothetical protein